MPEVLRLQFQYRIQWDATDVRNGGDGVGNLVGNEKIEVLGIRKIEER